MSVLFEPQRLGRIEIQNRLVRSATYYGLADENGRVGDASAELMKTLAGNDVGLIITGYAFVARSGQVFPDMNGIDSDEQIPGYRRMTRAVHDLQGRVVMQIAHGGVASTTAVRRGEPRLAVSAGEGPSDSEKDPREMTDGEIEAIIDAFGRAARRVEEAGFDGVQIHGAHGYLVTQFLSPRSNRRGDRWGGSLENRMRFAVEVVRAIRRQVDAGLPGDDQARSPGLPGRRRRNVDRGGSQGRGGPRAGGRLLHRGEPRDARALLQEGEPRQGEGADPGGVPAAGRAGDSQLDFGAAGRGRWHAQPFR